MTSLPAAYTPLESLLLFQALRAEGVTPVSFNRISDQLNSVPSVRDDPTYERDRLSPEALRELYLGLLKQEAKRALEQQLDKDSAVVNGVGSPGSRKRKAPSPTLPTVQDAAQHSHLIPQLVKRLYARYREKTVQELRQYERQHVTLSRERKEIESGMWDERVQKQPSKSAPQSPKPSTSTNTQPAPNVADCTSSVKQDALPPSAQQRAADSPPQTQPPRFTQAKIDAVINHEPEPETSSSHRRRTSSNTTLPPLSEMAPQSPHFAVPPAIPAQVSTQMPYMQQTAAHGYMHSPTNAHHSPYAPHAHPLPSPQLQNAYARPASSPRILPPPRGMQLPAPTTPHAQSAAMQAVQVPPQQYYQPQHRGPNTALQSNDRAPRGYAPLQASPSQAYYQPLQAHTFPDRRTSYPPPPPSQPSTPYPPQPPRVGGYQLQPFQVEPSKPASRSPAQPIVPATQPSAMLSKPVSLQPQQTASSPAQARSQQPLQPTLRVVSDILAALATPPKTETQVNLWKPERVSAPLTARKSPPRPEVEPISPIRARVKSSLTGNHPPQSTAVGEESNDVEKALTRRTRQLRNTSPQSVTSSAAAETIRARTRSQSVSTAVDNQAAEDGQAPNRHLKPEPSTPAPTIDESESVRDPSATPVAGRVTRKRAGTLQSQTAPSTKRLRRGGPTLEDADRMDTPPSRPTTVLATRNFAKMSATIMNDINSHKHASYFAGPVRNKDASGYSEIIKQPQNLKSIRAAINAGTRAVAAATAAAESPSVTTTSATATKSADGAATVELERTADLIPPKAITNGAQLEKEIYRMLANAVMFNPGEDGLVQDTREMFRDVHAKIAEWRGAEREAGEVEEDESKPKRRKV